MGMSLDSKAAAAPDAGDISQRFALDTNGFDAMRAAVKNTPLAGAKMAARQFDAVFLNMMLKSMQEATPSNGMLDSETSKTYMSMLDQQLAQTLSTKGVGMADKMIGQLLRNQGVQVGPDGMPIVNDANGSTSASGAINTNAMLNMLATQAYASQHGGGSSLSQHAENFNQDDGNIEYQGDDRKQAFVDKLGSAAKTASAASGIPARFILSHAALESGWGRHEIRQTDGSSSHNVFGIKAGNSWTGRTVTAMTTEYSDGVPQRVKAKFRAYDSYDDAMVDYAKLLKNNPRYANTMASSHDAVGFATGLQRAGYATDPAYAKKLVKIMQQMV
jgi:peptidoglycan hydrolase FlgJ